MESNKPRTMIIGAILALSMISTGLLTGCTSNENSNVRYPVLSTTDSQILKAAYTEYESYKQTASYEEARNQLLETLNNNTEGVELAELGIDGYTIFITFSDGDFAGVNTFEPDEFPLNASELNTNLFSLFNEGASSQSSDYNVHTNILDGISFDAFAESNKKSIPESKKVLILGPCYYDFNTEPFEDSVEYFKDHGWTDDDIILKVVDDKRDSYGVNYSNLQPEDFFDLEDYGIVIYTGHGGTNIYRNFNEDNIYLQFCFITNDTYNTYPDFKTWKDEKKILVYKCDTQLEGDESVDWYTTALRADVLKEKINSLPSSYVHLSTCYGAYFEDVFLSNNAAMFLGWTDKANGDIADENMLKLNTLLVGNNACLYDAYMDDTITKVVDWPYNEFNIYSKGNWVTEASQYYFPAWLNLIVTGIPSGTSSIHSSLYDSTNTLLGEAVDTVGASITQIECENLKNILTPPGEETTVEIKAYSSGGQELATGQKTITVHTGRNTLQIALTQSGGLTIEFPDSAETGLLDAKRVTQGLSIDANIQNRPTGQILYIWDSTGDSSLGGFGYYKQQHIENTNDNNVYYYSNGTGGDGTIISITCTAYIQKENNEREILSSDSAEIEVYNPSQIYELCGSSDGTTGLYLGSGSDWNFYIVDHGPLYGNQFFARKGDQIRAYCRHTGYMSEGLTYDMYIRKGTLTDPPTETQLIISQSEIVDGLNKIVTITI
ncbi:MAG: hypothetical protein V1726_07540 [Methanobacteriota archaeon]